MYSPSSFGKLESSSDLTSTDRAKFLLTQGQKLQNLYRSGSIKLIELTSNPTIDFIKARVPNSDLIYACDFYVQDIEQGSRILSGYEFNGLVNIDHHSKHEDFYTQVSSGVLAINHVVNNGPVEQDVPVVINHTDCDSTISSLIMRGYLDPHPIFAEAVIAADHTGEENPIADLLQALDVRRDLDFSVRNLIKLLQGQPLDPHAQELLEQRHQSRLYAQQEAAHFTQDGLLAHHVLVQRLDGEFLPSLLPTAAVIVYFYSKNEGQNSKWVMKARLGNMAPAGATLFDLNINDFDPHFGGRWNAGGNDRGGFGKDPSDYVSYLLSQLNKADTIFNRTLS
jgi:hypothetical protein